MMMMSDTQCKLPQKLIGPHKAQEFNRIVSAAHRYVQMYLHIPPYKCAYLLDCSYIYKYFADIACLFAHVFMFV